MLKTEYPSAIKRKVTGDWNCPHCGNLNFSFRNECNKCHFTRTEFKESGFHSALYLFLPDVYYDDECVSPTKTKVCEIPSVSPLFTEKYFKAPTKVKPITTRQLNYDPNTGKA